MKELNSATRRDFFRTEIKSKNRIKLTSGWKIRRPYVETLEFELVEWSLVKLKIKAF